MKSTWPTKKLGEICEKISRYKWWFLISLIIVILVISMFKSLNWFNQNSGGVQAISSVLSLVVTIIFAWIALISLQETRHEKEKSRIQEIYDVVIYPLIKHFETIYEIFRDKKIDLSSLAWSFKIASMFNKGVEEIIFKEFITIYPHLHEKFREFDQLVEKLIEAWKKFEEKINSIPEFKQKIDEKWKEYEQPIEANPPQYNWIIEWILNEKEELIKGHGYYEFWERYKKDFLIFRNDERLKEEKEEFDRSQNTLFFLPEEILKELKRIANELSVKYGIKIYSSKENLS